MKFTYNEKSITWDSVLNKEITFDAAYKVIPTKGNMAWEYNPFRNYRLDQDMYEYDGEYYTLDQIKKMFPDEKITDTLPDGVTCYQAGELVDFITDQLSFDINHPVTISPSYSYDGSVDLVINDGKNQPRLINSRFSVEDLNTYRVIDRKGNNDTNIYDRGDQFDVDTSLYKKVNKIPKVTFNGTQSGGSLPIGNYHFYFKLADADGNETDFIAESGLVSIFKGVTSPYSVSTGQKNESSLKCASFTISNIDAGYQYLHVYYSRSTAEGGESFVTSAVKINQDFLVNSLNTCSILVTGAEDTTEIPLTDINLDYNIVQSAKSQAICQNMLFLANVKKTEPNAAELQDLSLRFYPFLKFKNYNVSEDQNYSVTSTEKGYLDAKYIYNYTGYWDSDLYRLGIVYILKDGSTTSVYNIRGREKVKGFNEYDHLDNVASAAYTQVPIYKEENGVKTRQYINYNEQTYYIVRDNEGQINSNSLGLYENVKGVVSLDSSLDTNAILGFDIRADEETITELKKYVKGFFFVRQRRLPLTLCQGITIGIEKNSRLPAIPTVGGVTDITYNNTYVTTRDTDSNEVHYLLEGFLGRYTYKLKAKHAGFWSKVFKAFTIVSLVAAALVTAYLTGGASLFATGGLLAGALGTTVLITGIALGSGLVATAVVAGAQEISLSAQRSRNKTEAAKPFRGRNESIPKGYVRAEVDESRKLDASYQQRIILTDDEDCSIEAMYVPEYTVNAGKYNQLFNGDEFQVQYANSQPITNYTNIGYFQNNGGRHFYISGYQDYDNKKRKQTVNLLGVPDGIAVVGLKNVKFRSKAGDASSANRFQCVKYNYKDEQLNTDSDIVRGNYSPYVAMVGFSGPAASILNIKIPGYKESNLDEYIKMRIADNSEYSAISDRFDISDCMISNTTNLVEDTTTKVSIFQTDCYRGDCYICQYTQRVNRNFNDDTLPYNDTIVDPNSWRNYDATDATTLEKVNVGDLNAVELGMWVTFRVRSNYNLNIRTEDGSQATEKSTCGHARSYYPRMAMTTDGSYKISDSQVYNLGFSKSLSDRYHFGIPDVPYIKDWYGTRIMYSDINITDGFKNGFRTFRSTAYQDYTREYGSITKIVELQGNLIVVFEHGVGFLEVNEKAVAAQSASGNAYITTNNVLPEKITVISDAVGSQWADSVIKVPAALGSQSSVIFGVDTVAKKIWACTGSSVKCISDFKVQEFLNNNITLGERDTNVILGTRNVKSFYNAFKQDVMFTFYDYLEGFEERAWNLCYNMTLEKFITFYSWIPAFMENIDNIPFSFDREVLKKISKLGISKEGSDFADGIVLSNNVLTGDSPQIGKLSLANRVIPFDGQDSIKVNIKYEVVRDNQGNYKLFDIATIDGESWLVFKSPVLTQVFAENDQGELEQPVIESEYGNKTKDLPVYILKADAPDISDLNAELYYRNWKGNSYSDWPSSSNQPNYASEESEKYTWKSRDIITQDVDTYKSYMKETLDAIVKEDLPIYKDRSGRRLMLPEADRINEDTLVRYVNIRATIYIDFNDNKSMYDRYKAAYGDNSKEDEDLGINCGYYESAVAITTKWNMQFLTSDFWKHGQAGLIDICDDIKPTVWYGKQHPFEFECVVVNDPGVQKIFQNLELLANKAEPESFHFEIVGESYDFAKDKATMFFRQEARKALLQYNGVDITYDRNFLKVTPTQHPKSAELVYRYYERQDKLQEIKDTYRGTAINDATYSKLNDYKCNDVYNSWALLTPNKDYRSLSGAEIVYYKNRNEYRIWQHQPAINLANLPQDSATSFLRGNCQYLEDRWRVSINPLLICYKNEYNRTDGATDFLFQSKYSTWFPAYSNKNTKLPPITIFNTSLPHSIKTKGNIEYPTNGDTLASENALYELYDVENNSVMPVDITNWLNDPRIYKTNFGEAQNRKEAALRDKFMKVRVRYSGEDLAIIDALLTTYTLSYV